MATAMQEDQRWTQKRPDAQQYGIGLSVWKSPGKGQRITNRYVSLQTSVQSESFEVARDITLTVVTPPFSKAANSNDIAKLPVVWTWSGTAWIV